MRVLITGRGSIAKRHVEHLHALTSDLELAVVSNTGELDTSFQPCHIAANFAEGMAWLPDAVVVASISSRHADDVIACLMAGLPCLIEKPLVVSHYELLQIRQAYAAQPSHAVLVGCNLRYLPALQVLRAALHSANAGTVVRAHLEVGQDLAQWRPVRDLKSSYSAHAELGGGVVFDLVHEIDMARWLFGPLQVRAAVGGQLGLLSISADDVHVALLKSNTGAPIVVSLDYISKKVVRRYLIVTTTGTYEFDLISKRLSFCDGCGGGDGTHQLTDQPEDFDVSQTYLLQIQDWLLATKRIGHVVATPIADAFETAELMLAMKDAAA